VLAPYPTSDKKPKITISTLGSAHISKRVPSTSAPGKPKVTATLPDDCGSNPDATGAGLTAAAAVELGVGVAALSAGCSLATQDPSVSLGPSVSPATVVGAEGTTLVEKPGRLPGREGIPCEGTLDNPVLETLGTGAEAPGPTRLGRLMETLDGAAVDLETVELGFGVATNGWLAGAGWTTGSDI
jgi:hypothetical protein